MGSSNREVVDSDLWLQLHAPSLEFDFGDGLPLSPSKFWWRIRRFIKANSPKSVKVPDDNVFVSEDQRTFLEYTSMRGWVEEWLDYYLWWLRFYRCVNNLLNYQDPLVKVWIDRITTDMVFNAPVPHADWRVSNIEDVKLRYSLLQRVKRELKAVPDQLVLPMTSDHHKDDTSIHEWCTCINKNDVLFSEGMTGFSVSMEGLRIPPCILCSICSVIKCKSVQVGTRNLPRFRRDRDIPSYPNSQDNDRLISDIEDAEIS